MHKIRIKKVQGLTMIKKVYLPGGGINHEGARVNYAYLPAYPNNLSKLISQVCIHQAYK